MGPLISVERKVGERLLFGQIYCQIHSCAFFLQNFTYKKRVWGKLQTIPYSMSYTYNIQEIFYQMILNGFFKKKANTNHQHQFFPFHFLSPDVFYYRWFFWLGSPDFLPDIMVVGFSVVFQGAKLRSALPLLGHEVGFSKVTKVLGIQARHETLGSGWIKG